VPAAEPGYRISSGACQTYDGDGDGELPASACAILNEAAALFSPIELII
jgi:hypothetical protein